MNSSSITRFIACFKNELITKCKCFIKARQVDSPGIEFPALLPCRTPVSKGVYDWLPDLVAVSYTCDDGYRFAEDVALLGQQGCASFLVDAVHNVPRTVLK
jgi:hypothetical protein